MNNKNNQKIKSKLRKLEERKNKILEKYRELQRALSQKNLPPEKKSKIMMRLYQKMSNEVAKIDTQIVILRRKLEVQKNKKESKGRRELTRLVEREKEVLKRGVPPTLEAPLVQFVSPENYEVIEEYPAQEPYSYIKILRNKDTSELLYYVVEPTLTPEEVDTMNQIKDILITSIVVYPEEVGEDKKRFIEDLVERVVADYGIRVSRVSLEKIKYYIARDFAGYGPIDPIMKDPWIEDISCDGPGIPIFVFHRKYQSIRTNVVFPDEISLDNFVIRLAQISGKHISVAHPLLDATLPDGSRAQLSLRREVTTRGSTFTIRKFREVPFSPAELVDLGTASDEMMGYFWLAVEYGASAIFAGGTASGKTTSLNAISMFIPPNEKIVSIEDTREINLPHPNWIPGVTRSGFGGEGREIDMYDLLRAALRQRPRYIIVGEVRGREAYVMFQAMATGHTTYSTFHAESPQALVHRFTQDPINIPRIMLSSLDIISLQKFVRIKGRPYRKISEIVEIIDVDPTTQEILTNTVFRWIPETNEFEYAGKSYVLEKISKYTGKKEEELEEEMRRRGKIIAWMRRHRLYNYKDVSRVIFKYYSNPEEILEKVKRNVGLDEE